MTELTGIGIDTVEVGRVRSLLARLPAAEQRLFTTQELAYCHAYADPVPHLAARFACKEAVGKALGTGVIRWRDIEVLGGRRPCVHLSGATEAAARGQGVSHLELSLSHTAAQAVAVAVALKEDGDG